MLNIEAIEQAISDLNSQKVPNIRATAKKYNVVHSTLLHHFNKQTVSRNESQSKSNMLLTNAQESALIEYLNKLSTHGLHPTPQILKNLVVEIVKHFVGERWIEHFYKHHNDMIQSIYLRSIDQAKYVINNSKHFQNYFNQVCIQYSIICLYLAYINFN